MKNFALPAIHRFIVAALLLAASSATFAQSGQKYSTSGNALADGDKIGSTNNQPISIVANNQEAVKILPDGRVLFRQDLTAEGAIKVAAFAGTGFRLCQVDANGNIVLFNGTNSAEDIVLGNGTFGNFKNMADARITNFFSNSASNVVLGNGTFYPLSNLGSQWVDGANNFVSYSNGHIGIGTQTDATMGVAGALTFGETASDDGINFNDASTSGFGAIRYNGYAKFLLSDSQFGTGIATGGIASGGFIKFYNYNLTNTLATITDDGKMGIKTTSPQANLDVNGTMRITDGSQGAGKILTSDANGNATWQTPSINANNVWSINGTGGTDAASNFIGTTDAADFVMKTNGIERMRITAGGSASFQSDNVYIRYNPTTTNAEIGSSQYRGIAFNTHSGTKLLIGRDDGVTVYNHMVINPPPYTASVQSTLEVGNFSGALGNISSVATGNIVLSQASNGLGMLAIGVQSAVPIYGQPTMRFTYDPVSFGGNIGTLNNNNYRIGIGMNTQSTSRVSIADGLYVSGGMHIVDGSEGNGKVLTSDANGNATWQNSGTSSQWADGSNGNISYSGGNVGIKNNTPAEALDVTGNAKISGNITANSLTLNGTGTTFTTPSAHVTRSLEVGNSIIISGLTTTPKNEIYTDNEATNSGGTSNDLYIQSNTGFSNNTIINQYGGNVGIGTASPNHALHIAGGNLWPVGLAIENKELTTNNNSIRVTAEREHSIIQSKGDILINYYNGGGTNVLLGGGAQSGVQQKVNLGVTGKATIGNGDDFLDFFNLNHQPDEPGQTANALEAQVNIRSNVNTGLISDISAVSNTDQPTYPTSFRAVAKADAYFFDGVLFPPPSGQATNTTFSVKSNGDVFSAGIIDAAGFKVAGQDLATSFGQWTTAGANIYRNTGNVFIGSTPSSIGTVPSSLYNTVIKPGLLMQGKNTTIGFRDNPTSGTSYLNENGEVAIEYENLPNGDADFGSEALSGLNFYLPWSPGSGAQGLFNYRLFISNHPNTLGHIGIGTPNPKARLEIRDMGTRAKALRVTDAANAENFLVYNNGEVFSREYTVTMQDFSDYVFDTDYNLISIEDAEKFFKENHHLKGVPSAKEIKVKGLNLGEMQKIQMEKIEELYLYVVELKKQNTELQNRLNKLENK